MKFLYWMCILMIAALSTVTAADEAFVFSLKGEVKVENKTEERLLSPGEFIQSGDTVRTGPQSRVTLIFADDTQITLTGGKTLTVRAKTGEEKNSDGKRGGLRGLWRRITGKSDDAEYAASLGTVGAVRGEEDIPLGDLVLYEDEKRELIEELEAVEQQFQADGEKNLMKAIIYESFEQYVKADTHYSLALQSLEPSPYLYDLAIDFYLKAEQYERADELTDQKEALLSQMEKEGN